MMFNETDLIFSDISIKGKIPENSKKEDIIAMCLNDWALCTIGNKPPTNFGLGMVEAGKILGIGATSDNLMKLADTYLKKNNEAINVWRIYDTEYYIITYIKIY